MREVTAADDGAKVEIEIATAPAVIEMVTITGDDAGDPARVRDLPAGVTVPETTEIVGTAEIALTVVQEIKAVLGIDLATDDLVPPS